MFLRVGLLFWLALAPAGAQTRSVALTFDDLPLAGTSKSSSAAAISQNLLSALANHHAPAIGFVNTNDLRPAETLGPDGEVIHDSLIEQWIGHGQDLGNHSFSHADLNRLSIAAFEQEILYGGIPLQSFLAKAGKQLEYFRFPFNHTGDTKEKHDAIASFLAQHGYRLAPCTIDNSDYIFDRAYVIAFARHDEASRAKIRSEYLAYTVREIDYYTELHKEVLGHEIPHIMLLHANQLNADVVQEILAILEAKHYAFVDLATALSDPAYQIPDTFISAYGPMWGYRWARELNIKIDGSREAEPPAWISAYGTK